MEKNFSMEWNEKFLVWNGCNMEKILRNGIRKNRLSFHSMACPAGSCESGLD